MSIFRIHVVVVAVCLCLTACHIKVPKPDQPIVEINPGAVEVSRLTVPITASLASAVTAINNAVPTNEDHDRGNQDWIIVGDVGGDLGVRYYWERSPIGLAISGNVLTAAADARYRGRGGVHTFLGWADVCCGCGEPLRTMSVTFSSPLQWTPDYRLVPDIRTAVNPTSACTVTEANIDVTKHIVNRVKSILDNKVGDVNAALSARLNFRDKAESAWQYIQRPISIGNNASLVINPVSLSASAITGSSSTCGITLSLEAKPELKFGGAPSATTTPLPPLREGTGDGFHIALPVEYSYDDASNAINNALRGRLYPINGKKVRIESARVYGSGDAVILEVTFSGSKKGTIYFSGQPSYNALTQEISIQNLDFTLETRNVLLKAADWLLHDGFRGSLAAQAHWSVGDKVDTFRQDVTQALNRTLTAGVTLTGSVDNMRPLGVGITSSGLKTVLVADGRAAINVQ